MDSLAALIPPHDRQLSTGNQKQPSLDFHQGLVKEWDQQLGTNIVEVAGTDLYDLPALNSSDIVIINAGDTVGILRYRSTYFILGRIVLPGSNQSGNSAVSFTSGTASAFNFTVTAASATKATTNLLVPSWADEALISAHAFVFAFNDSGGVDYLYVAAEIEGFGGQEMLNQCNNNSWVESSSASTRLVFAPFTVIPQFGLGIRVNCNVHSSFNTWTAQPSNTALLTAQATFRRSE